MIEKLQEECGVFGIYSADESVNVAYACYNGLLALQHRGQESCGIAVNNKGLLSYHKGVGLVTEVFKKGNLNHLPGQIGLGHVRQSEEEFPLAENSQPLIMHYAKGPLAISFNGVLTNSYELKRELERRGSIFQQSSAPEIIAYLIARERVKTHSIEDALKKVVPQLQGSFSFCVLSPRKIIAVRDPNGIKPLCIGSIDDKNYCVSSESCALDAVGARLLYDVEPGEIVVITNDGVKKLRCDTKNEKRVCIFEYIYFARSDSIIDGVSVYEARKESGRLLAKLHPCEADIVIGTPESGLDAAIGYAEVSGLKYEKGIVKNGYIGRTFIKPTQDERERSVRLKLNGLSSAIEGKRVVLLDDSIVRGTTSKRMVKMLHLAGAKEVHLRISSPPFLWPCFFGTDVPSRENLIAANHTTEQIAEIVGANSLGYLDVKSLSSILGKCGPGYCDACFSNEYPQQIPESARLGKKSKYMYPLSN